MENDSEFRKIGKRLPYKSPEGFFDHVSETTLRKAKQRQIDHRKALILWRTIAVAASLIIALIGYYSIGKVEPEIVVADVINVKDSILPIHETNNSTENLVKSVIAEKKADLQINVDNEKFSDILADLSDEELQQMAAFFRTDPFMEGVQQ